MADAESVEIGTRLQPLPYHVEIREFLRREDPEIWQWYRSNRIRDEAVDAARFELLKTTYRVDRAEQPRWYDLASRAMRELGLDVPLTIYRAHHPDGCNASIAGLPDQAHLVLHGPIGERLDDDELLALLSHELSHLLLWHDWDGDFLTVDQVLNAFTNDPQATGAHFASARYFRLYSEVFCDRGSLHVVQDPLIVVAALVKSETGAESVNAENYLRQAEEIFERDSVKTEGLTHPEAYIRARAIHLWARDGAAADEVVGRMIEGPADLNDLDLLGQLRVAKVTRRLIGQLLRPEWMRTDLVLSHARTYFDDFDCETDAAAADDPIDGLDASHPTMTDYYCFVLLDFISADRDLEELPLASALVLAERLGIKQRLIELARKELRLRKGQVDKIDKDKQQLLAGADGRT